MADFERAHGQTLFGFVRRLGVKDDAAADVVQEAILRLFDALCAGQRIRDSKRGRSTSRTGWRWTSTVESRDVCGW